MGLLELFLIAVGLSMDAFAVSVCKGLSERQLKAKHYLIIGAWFGGFQAIMPTIGYLLGSTFEQYITAVDHWIAFVLLCFIGGNMIREALSKDEEKLDASFSFKTMLLLAIATSIDALAIGISFAFLGVQDYTQILSPICIIGLVSFVMSLIGLIFGIQCGCGIARKLKAELWGGIILVIIGLKILVEHLFFQ